jgi:hypothetical protein
MSLAHRKGTESLLELDFKVRNKLKSKCVQFFDTPCMIIHDPYHIKCNVTKIGIVLHYMILIYQKSWMHRHSMINRQHLSAKSFVTMYELTSSNTTQGVPETGDCSTTSSESVQMYVKLVLARMKLILVKIITTGSGKYMMKKCDILNQ